MQTWILSTMETRETASNTVSIRIQEHVINRSLDVPNLLANPTLARPFSHSWRATLSFFHYTLYKLHFRFSVLPHTILHCDTARCCAPVCRLDCLPREEGRKERRSEVRCALPSQGGGLLPARASSARRLALSSPLPRKRPSGARATRALLRPTQPADVKRL